MFQDAGFLKALEDRERDWNFSETTWGESARQTDGQKGVKPTWPS